MNEEEVLTTEEQQEQPQQQSTARQPGQTIESKVDNVGKSLTNAGKTVENFGKAEEKLGGFLKGEEKVADAASEGVDAASSAIKAGASAADKVVDAQKNISKGVAETARGVGQTADAVKTGADTVKQTSAATSRAGDAMLKAGAATSEVGVGAPVAVAGGATKVVSDAANVISTGVGGAAATTSGAAKLTEGAARASEAAADVEKTAIKGAETAAGGVNKANKLAKKGNEASSVLADKLQNRGRKHIAFGKKMQQVGGNLDSESVIDNFFGTGGYVGKITGGFLKALLKVFSPTTFAIIVTLIIAIFSTILTYLLSPMFYLDGIRDFLSDPDNVEKATNYFAGLGFQDSEKAFYEELEYLNAHYDNKLDYSYIMAALYYIDLYHGESEYYKTGDSSKICGETTGKPCENLQVGFQLSRTYLEEAESTVGSDGHIYSANKIYRLRQLAKSQFLGDKTISSLPLDEYIELCMKKMDAEQKKFMKALPYVIAHIIAHALGFGDAFNLAASTVEGYKLASDIIKVFEGTESWASVKLYFDNGKYFTDTIGFIKALGNFIGAYFDCFFNIESITIDQTKLSSYAASATVNMLLNPLSVFYSSSEKTSGSESNDDGMASESETQTAEPGIASFITINYYEYSFSQDEYENYLTDYYIRYMPEFSKFIKDENGKVSEDKIYGIAYDIKLIKELYDSLYNKNQSAKEYKKCVGNMNLDLIDQLHLPIDLEIGTKITFKGTNNYGLYKGTVHEGVDLENTSTGTKAGDKVYSVYTGRVLESTYDNTFSNPKVKGGWAAIEYIVQYEDTSMGESKLAVRYRNRMSTIIVYYGGLSTKDFTLKKGQAVKKGEVIGHVGTAAESENGAKASLHFGVYDVWADQFLSPVNIFISCRDSSSTTKMCGKDNKEKIWTFLLSKGYTKIAAAGIMGVWERESGFKPYVVQGWGAYDSKSKAYTADVDSGKISRNAFAKDKQGGGGYGLAQWTTASRKRALYDYAKKKGKSIGDLQTQLEFFEKEINSGVYKNKKVKGKLNKATTIEESTKIFLNLFEGGQNSSLELRTKYAKQIYNDYKDFTCQ